ncbi:delta(7)-sterol-C5(6)-desaturase-like [Nymphaea colorata]|nr:delta(7)-sterol-C5(6)-desaturase-like [Nymphaea colorata]
MEGKTVVFNSEIDGYNEVVLGNLLHGSWRSLPRFCQSILRNYVGFTILYFVCSALWSLYAYRLNPNVSSPEVSKTRKNFIVKHIWQTMKAMPGYILLEGVSEYMVEQGWTRCYSAIEDVGWPMYFVYFIVYLVIVELGIYWVHRASHEVKLLYRLSHAQHHVYNSKHKVSPFAALAVDPLDGMLHTLPFILATLLVPTHFLTHLLVLFCEGVWSINIHSTIDSAEIWPLMGPSYHLVHHCRPNYNYGNYTIFMDWLFGTLRRPESAGAKNEKNM